MLYSDLILGIELSNGNTEAVIDADKISESSLKLQL